MNRRPLVRRARRRLFPLQFEAMESRLLLAAPFLVTTTVDNGNNVTPTPGSLRQAILIANFIPGQDTIDFQIGSGGFQAIFPPSPLPPITDKVIINGTSQPGYTTFPLIAIVGSSILQG